MDRYRFARRPKWIFGHVLVLLLVVGFVNAGLWQLRRLHQRKAFNAKVEHNQQLPVAPLGQVLTSHDGFGAIGKVIDRRVRATGHYLVDEEVLISGQGSPQGDPGAWIITPLLQDDGTVVLVNRGWISSNGNFKVPPAAARPPAGRVTVVGLLSKTQTPGWFESHDPATGHLTSLVRVDVGRIAKQLSQPVVPAFVQRSSQSPPDAGRIVPTELPPPSLGDGPHLGYAFQWFSFTALALIAYPILLRKVARDHERGGDGDGPEGVGDHGDLPDGAFVDEDGVIDLTGVPR